MLKRKALYKSKHFSSPFWVSAPGNPTACAGGGEALWAAGEERAEWQFSGGCLIESPSFSKEKLVESFVKYEYSSQNSERRQELGLSGA